MQSSYKAEERRTEGAPGDAERWAVDYLTRIIQSDLAPLASHGIKAISDFFAAVPATRFLPLDYRRQWIRWHLYVEPGEWDAASAAVDARDRPVIAERVARANATGDQELWKDLQMAPDGFLGYKIPASARLGAYTAADVARQPLTVDHIVAIAEHWTNRQGNNTGDGPRQTIGSGLANLVLVTREYNSHKGSGAVQYSDWVEGGFESQMSPSPRMSRTIAGREFVRTADGAPL